MVLEEWMSGTTELGKKRPLKKGTKRHKAEFSVLLIYTTLEPTV